MQYFLYRSAWVATFPDCPHVQTKNQKEKGEPGKIYHVRNIIHVGRENLITSVGERMNSPTLYGQNILIQLQNFMTNRTGLGSTTLHYLSERQAVVSIFRA